MVFLRLVEKLLPNVLAYLALIMGPAFSPIVVHGYRRQAVYLAPQPELVTRDYSEPTSGVHSHHHANHALLLGSDGIGNRS